MKIGRFLIVLAASALVIPTAEALPHSDAAADLDDIVTRTEWLLETRNASTSHKDSRPADCKQAQANKNLASGSLSTCTVTSRPSGMESGNLR
jgi:hypothetical protein